MKGNILLVLILTLFLQSTSYSQQAINNYSFIEVPEMFEFLRSKDQYQLNSLTKFLFNKYGFNAYFGEELPNVKKCDGLYADIEGSPGFVYTKITVVVKDCNGLELYRSAEGKSKLKEYKKAYHQALRRAFESFETLGVAQPKVAVNEPVSNEKSTNKSSLNEAKPLNLPTAKFSNYSYDGTSYLLRKTASGYTFSQEMIGAEDDLMLVGKLKVVNNKILYTNSNGVTYEASFDEDKNFIITLPSGFKKYMLVNN